MFHGYKDSHGFAGVEKKNPIYAGQGNFKLNIFQGWLLLGLLLYKDLSPVA